MSLDVHIVRNPDDNEQLRKGSKMMNVKNNNNTASCVPSGPKHPIPISSEHIAFNGRDGQRGDDDERI